MRHKLHRHYMRLVANEKPVRLFALLQLRIIGDAAGHFGCIDEKLRASSLSLICLQPSIPGYFGQTGKALHALVKL